MDIKGEVIQDMKWLYLAQDSGFMEAVLDTAMELRIAGDR